MKWALKTVWLFLFATSIAAASTCENLKADSDLRQALPGAVEGLCEKKNVPDCASRTAKACAEDALCFRHFGSSNCDPGSGPCLPDYVYKRCEAMGKERLEKLVEYYQLCRKTQGTWMKGTGGSQRYDAHCSCMGNSTTGLAFSQGGDGGLTQEPIVFYVDKRGCVSEKQLCKEATGQWVIHPRRHYCQINGVPVNWQSLGIVIGFKE